MFNNGENEGRNSECFHLLLDNKNGYIVKNKINDKQNNGSQTNTLVGGEKKDFSQRRFKLLF